MQRHFAETAEYRRYEGVEQRRGKTIFHLQHRQPFRLVVFFWEWRVGFRPSILDGKGTDIFSIHRPDPIYENNHQSVYSDIWCWECGVGLRLLQGIGAKRLGMDAAHGSGKCRCMAGPEYFRHIRYIRLDRPSPDQTDVYKWFRRYRTYLFGKFIFHLSGIVGKST